MNIEARKTNRQAVFLFGEGGPASPPAVLGGKGAGLADMVHLDVPVPPGFTVTTSVARAYHQHERLPRRLDWQIDRGITALERQTGKRFGARDGNPLLVSVRSGAATSMPGMMDTVLNLGMNWYVAEAMVQRGGFDARFVWDTYRRFLEMYGSVVCGVPNEVFRRFYENHPSYDPKSIARMDDYTATGYLRDLCSHFVNETIYYHGKVRYQRIPDSPKEQLLAAIHAVFGSWNSDRARLYREEHGIDHNLGTAATVQTMAFGNRDEQSCTGVVFSCDTRSGDPGLWGEFLPRAQGEDVVSGRYNARQIGEMREWNQELYTELEAHTMRLAEHYGYPVDVEFTVDSGQLYILQVRRAKLTLPARATVATHRIWKKQVTKEDALSEFTKDELKALSEPTFDQTEIDRYRVLARGTVASTGTAIGMAVYEPAEAVRLAAEGRSVILVRNDTTPEDLPGMLAAKAIVTSTGGPTCHAAVVARSLGKPAIVGCRYTDIRLGETISVDAHTGVVYRGEIPTTGSIDKKEINLLLRWAKQLKFLSDAALVFETMNSSLDVNQLLNDFYLVEAMTSALAGTKLEAQATALRDRVHQQAADTIAMYIVVAVAGELRHLRTDAAYGRNAKLPQLQPLREKFALRHGGEWTSTGNRTRVQHMVVDALRKGSIEDHLEFLTLAEQVFEQALFSSGYGGVKWATIARAPRLYLEGTLPLTVFVDHAFDLQHNNGSVFGKHTMLRCDRERLQDQLDIKKSESGVPRLYQRLMYSYHRVSQEVQELYFAGGKLGTW